MSITKISRRKFLKLTAFGLFSMPTMATGGYLYANKIELHWLDVERVELTLPRLAPAFNDYRLAQISDIHLGSGMTPEHLMDVVNQVNAQEPDAIAITGDFVSGSAELEQYKTDLIHILRKLQAPVYAVPGNHDHWTLNIESVREMMAEAGLMDLSNRVYTLKRGEARLHFAGLDDIWEEKHDLAAVLEQLPDEGAVVLLAHEPDYADTSATTGRFDLQISGHSHGGQINIPGIGAPVLPYLGQRYPRGLYQVGSMYQYTNRGVGTILPAVRFNCRPEITLFTFRTPEAT